MSEKQKDQHKNYGYEVTDARFKPIFIAGLMLFSVVALALVFIYGLFGFFGSMRADKMAPSSPLAMERQLPDGPRLQVDPNLDWQIFNARQDSVLNSAGWVMREAGVVRIPIERAMQIALQRGFPVRPDYDEDEK